MENATSDHIPSHGWLAAPKEKTRRAPSARTPSYPPDENNVGTSIPCFPPASGSLAAIRQACADCLVPEDLMRGILGQA
jgi:hypothetical protein